MIGAHQRVHVFLLFMGIYHCAADSVARQSLEIIEQNSTAQQLVIDFLVVAKILLSSKDKTLY